MKQLEALVIKLEEIIPLVKDIEKDSPFILLGLSKKAKRKKVENLDKTITFLFRISNAINATNAALYKTREIGRLMKELK